MARYRFAGSIALLAVLPFAVGACGASTAKGQRVSVLMGEDASMHTMYVKPEITTFKVGQAYDFVVKNEGMMAHEFTIAPPRQAGQDEDDLDKLSLLDADSLEPGKTRTLHFTFKKAAPPGTLEFECSYPGHYEAGQHIPIVVEP